MQRPHEVGRRAEDAAAAHLVAFGVELLDRNVRVGHWEVDILAREGRVVLVVEVRCRGGGAWQSAFGSLDPAKRRRVRWAGERLWRQRFRTDPRVDRLRYDAVSVTFEGGEPLVEWAKAAF